MTKELIERLAREAGFKPVYRVQTYAPERSPSGALIQQFEDHRFGDELRRFAALVAEECAKECEARGRNYREAKAPGWLEVDHEATQNAYAIRAKFKEPPT